MSLSAAGLLTSDDSQYFDIDIVNMMYSLPKYNVPQIM